MTSQPAACWTSAPTSAPTKRARNPWWCSPRTMTLAWSRSAAFTITSPVGPAPRSICVDPRRRQPFSRLGEMLDHIRRRAQGLSFSIRDVVERPEVARHVGIQRTLRTLSTVIRPRVFCASSIARSSARCAPAEPSYPTRIRLKEDSFNVVTSKHNRSILGRQMEGLNPPDFVTPGSSSPSRAALR